MSKVLKAKVLSGRYKDQIVRISNVSSDELGKKNAACILPDNTRANIPVQELEVIPTEAEPTPQGRFAKTASMPFISGSSSSRTLTHTKNMQRPRGVNKCEICGKEYDPETRRGRTGKITQCENCAENLS